MLTGRVGWRVAVALSMTVLIGAWSLQTSARASDIVQPPEAMTARAIEAREPVRLPRSPTDRLFYVTLYGDIWAHTDLITLPAETVEGKLRTKNIYFVAASIGYTLAKLPVPFCACGTNGFRLEIEGKLGRYFGLQDHFESALVLMLRSPQFPLLFGFSGNVAVGEGVSYAFDLPKFEGSVAAEGSDAAGPRRFLNYLALEMEFSHEQIEAWHLLLNVHHRSGIWGVIAPQNTGANYIGGGIRRDF